MTLKGAKMLNVNTGKLRRTQTIDTDSVNWRPETTPPPENVKHGINGADNGGDSDKVWQNRPAPGPSCQALKHAVNALSRLDDFTCEKLGEGFFAEVFKIIHKTTGVVQCLKMNKIQDNKPNVLRELQLMNRLSHKNILRFMGVCVHEGQLHAITEFISGGDLEQLLQKKTLELPWTLRVKIAHDIACGISYLHSRGVMHRDLTSKNVLVRDDENGYTAVVADFGLSAKIPDPRSIKKLSTVGSPFWMAPEVINGYHYNELADVFSYGVICLEITARISSDPDDMPRTQNFGIDYKAFSEIIEYCPLDFLRLAYRCCQIDYTKRPPFSELETSMLQLFENLRNDNASHVGKERRNSTDGSNYKRSRSEDNILQVNGDDFSEQVEFKGEPDVTAIHIAEAMSRDDPFYLPSDSNPFTRIEGFRVGHKLVGKSFADGSDVIFDLPSPSSPSTPPCTPNVMGASQQRRSSKTFHRKSQSLPSSPVLLRKAAERFHQESIYGSQTKQRTISTNRYSFSAYGTRSKSVFFPEAVAQKLQYEMYDTGSPYDGRSREGSVETDYQLTFNNTFPVIRHRRFSQLESRSNSISPSNSFNCSRQESINGSGDHKNENETSSVYPSIKYATTAKGDQKLSNLNMCYNKDSNNKDMNKSSLDGPCVGPGNEPVSPLSSIPDTDIYNPWSMRREALTETSIIEETSSSHIGVMETSV